MKRYLYPLLIFVASHAGAQVTPVDTTEAERQLNEAVKIIMRMNHDPASTDSIIALADKALSLDSNLFSAYSYKVNALLEAGRCVEALAVIKTVTARKPADPSNWGAQGVMTERLGNREAATEIYKHVIQLYDEELKDKPNDKFALANRAFFIMFVNGKETGLKEYRKVLKKYPEDEAVLFWKEVFEEFDRKQFIADFCK